MYVECAVEARSCNQFCLWNYKYYIFWEYVFIRCYQARNTHAPYWYLKPVPVCNIFPPYFKNEMIFK